MRINAIPDHVSVCPVPHCETKYSISLCDLEGSEIECLGGDDSMSDAWDYAKSYAKELGLRAVLYSDSEAQIIEEDWTP